MKRIMALVLAAAVAGCVAPPVPSAPPQTAQPAADAMPGRFASGLTPQQAARNFITVGDRVEPVAETICRTRSRGQSCDFRIGVDSDETLPPNAFQTRGPQGQPIIGFTLALIAEAQNQDELAFIMGHEAAHHIAGHIAKSETNAIRGAVLGGILAGLGGASTAGIQAAQRAGATLGARQYSKDFELEADALGTQIAVQAGFDPVRGAAFFSRLPDPGNRFLGTHPPNAQRIETVRRTAASLRAR